MEAVIPAIPEEEAGLPGPRVGEAIPRVERSQLFRAFSHREFRLLFTATSIGDLGFWFSHITLQSEMQDVTHKSAFWQGFLFFATFIPMLLFAPPAGVVADRVDRKRLLVVTRFLIGVAATVLAVLLHAGVESRGLLSGFGFVLGTLFAFLAPAQQAITANAVPSADLGSAISLLAAGNNLNRILGPAIGALILGAAGPGWAFTAYAAVNIVTVVLLIPIQISHRQEPSEHLGAWEQWKEGLRYARERTPALGVLITMSVLSVFGIAYVALYPVFTTEVFGRPKNDFTMLVIASGIGALIGALAVGFRRTGPSLRGALVWVVAFGIAAGAFTIARSWELALVLNIFVGFCYFSITTSLNTVLQELAEDEKRGRLSGLFTLTWAGLIPIGGIWMGTVADLGGAPLALQIGAGVCLVYAVGALLRSPTRYATVPPR